MKVRKPSAEMSWLVWDDYDCLYDVMSTPNDGWYIQSHTSNKVSQRYEEFRDCLYDIEHGTVVWDEE